MMQLFAKRSVGAGVWQSRGDSLTRNEAGVRVTHDTALSDDAVLAVVALLAGDIASLPLRALVTDEAGLTQPLRPQPEWLATPDPIDLAITSVAHKMQVALSVLLASNAYIHCEPNVFDPVRLTVLNPTRIRVIKPNLERLFEVMGRSNAYGDWTPGDQAIDTLSSAQVIHIPYLLRPGHLEGLSLIDAQAGNVAISLAMRKWVETFFGKGAQVGGFVSLPEAAGEVAVERVEDQVTKKWTSWRRAGVVGVLSGGAQWIRTGLTPQDADLDGMWKRQLQVAASIYGVPPFMVGSQEPAGVAYASSVERVQNYIDHCMNRYTGPMEQAYSRLVPGGADTGTRFVYDAFLKGDPKARWERHLAALQAKATTIGEIRTLENMRPMSDYTPEYLAGPDGLFQSPQNNAPDEAAPGGPA